MKQENAIEVRNVTKKFKVFYDKGSQLKEKILFRKRNRYEDRWVLKGISFEVKKGEAIGLIGHNGCGKSTTLKLLTKIIYPDSGSVEMKGRVSSLIELGAGFHPDMSGRENIYTNASIFGLTRKEINERMDDIIEFSELEEFLDNPVRTYSSGMYMRLAFSVAINVDADILLIDEILAVGDVNFQAKCFNRLREIKAQGTTIVIVSHSMGQIEQICDRSIWVHDGHIKAMGKPRDIHPEYLDFMGQKRQKTKEKQENSKMEKNGSEKAEAEGKESKAENHDETLRWGNGDARIKQISSFDKDGKECTVFKTGEPINFEVHYKVKQKIHNAVLGISIFRNDGLLCYGTHTRIDGVEEFDLEKNGMAVIRFENVNLIAGEYFIDFAITSNIDCAVDYYKNAYSFQIYSTFDDIGVARLDHTWEFIDAE